MFIFYSLHNKKHPDLGLLNGIPIETALILSGTITLSGIF